MMENSIRIEFQDINNAGWNRVFIIIIINYNTDIKTCEWDRILLCTDTTMDFQLGTCVTVVFYNLKLLYVSNLHWRSSYCVEIGKNNRNIEFSCLRLALLCFLVGNDYILYPSWIYSIKKDLTISDLLQKIHTIFEKP